MSELLFNIRFGSKHFQMTRNLEFRWIHNDVHDVRGPGWSWFAVYCIFGKHL